MKKSRVLTLGLACFFTAVTAFSAVAATSGRGALCSHLNDTSHAQNASTQQFSQTDEKSAPNAQNGLISPNDDDPVLFTTEGGLDIKYHASIAEGFGLNSYKGSSGFLYFTMGTYDSVPVNWIIIGRASNVSFPSYYIYDGTYSLLDSNLGTQYTNYTISDYPNHYTTGAKYYKNNPTETISPAGVTISSEISNDLVRDYLDFYVINQPLESSEIQSGCILCICEKNLYTSTYGNSVNNYNGSNLQTQMNNLYSSGLSLTSTQQEQIQPQKLTTYYGNYAESLTTITDQYLFPLAGQNTNETFYANTYLTSAQRSIGAIWWLRTPYKANGYFAYFVHTGGGIATCGNAGSNYGYMTNNYGIRPAFVLKI